MSTPHSVSPGQADQPVGRERGNPPLNPQPYVVAIFGRTGVGISSLVNLIAGHPVSKDNPNARTSAQSLESHPSVTFPGTDKQFCLYEVPGFYGRFSDGAILERIRQMDRKEGIDLFIYCLRKQKTTIMPRIVRRIRESVAGPDVPMIAVVTELERFEAEGGMEDWWDAPIEDGGTNGTFIERVCFEGLGTFAAYACVTTLPRREVDLVHKLRKRRERSEERVRRLILENCRGHKRQATSDPVESYSPFSCLSALLRFITSCF